MIAPTVRVQAEDFDVVAEEADLTKVAAARAVDAVFANIGKALKAGDSVALAGFACDAGVARNQGRIGAAKGPRALRKALAPLA